MSPELWKYLKSEEFYIYSVMLSQQVLNRKLMDDVFSSFYNGKLLTKATNKNIKNNKCFVHPTCTSSFEGTQDLKFLSQISWIKLIAQKDVRVKTTTKNNTVISLTHHKQQDLDKLSWSYNSMPKQMPWNCYSQPLQFIYRRTGMEKRFCITTTPRKSSLRRSTSSHNLFHFINYDFLTPMYNNANFVELCYKPDQWSNPN